MSKIHCLRGLTAAIALTVFTLAAGSSSAGLVLTDHPQGAAFDTFFNSLSASPDFVLGNGPQDPGGPVGQNRFGLDGPPNETDTATQSFTLGAPVDLDSIYYAYNDQRSTGTFDFFIDVDNNGSRDHSYSVTVTNALQSGGGNGGPVNFLQFDVSMDSIQLPAGVHSFGVEGTLDNETTVTPTAPGGFLIAPLHNLGDQFAGGEYSMQTLDGGDAIFALTGTVVPEPGSLALVVCGLAGIVTSRRRR